MDVENQPIEPTEAPDPNADATREDLLAAVKEAGGTASVRDAVADEANAAGDPPVEPVEEEPRIAGILKAREKAAAEREAARNEAEEMRAAARRESEQLRQQALEEARRDAAAERERMRAEFRADPVKMAREIAGGTENFVDKVLLADGSPQSREMAQLRADLEATKKLVPDVEAARKEIADMRAQAENEKRQAHVQRAMTEYMATATKEKAPYLNARYDEHEIIEKADKVALDWQRKGLKLNSDFDFNDVTQYLELEAKKRLASLGSPPAHQVSAGTPPKESGIAPKVSANGSRTLSAANGSERRTSPKPFSEMNREEQRAALIEEAAAARRANPKATY